MVKFVGLIQKKPGMTQDEFEKYWLDVHVPIMLKTPGVVKYRINIVDKENSMNPEAPIDGFSEVWFDSIESMNACLSSPEFDKIREDVPNFQSHIDRIVLHEHVIVE
jgi:uncharacterized protein (TIGR02118 family)